MDLNQPNTNQTPVPATPAADPPALQVEAPTAVPEVPPTSDVRQPKVLTIPSNAMAQIKREEREKGKKAALAELEALLKKHGFNSVEEMEKAAVSKNRPNRPNARPAAAPTRPAREPEASAPASAAPTPDRALRRAEREREHALEEARRHNTARSVEEKKRKRAEKELAAIQAEMELRTAAVRAGVKDVDYALELLRRSVRGKTAEELKSFDETVFFTKTMRASHPYLYGVTDVPANTTAPDVKQPLPGQQAPSKQEAPTQGGPIDARRMTPDQYSELLKRTGVKDPRTGL